MKVSSKSAIRSFILQFMAVAIAFATRGETGGGPISDLSDVQFVLRYWQSLLLPQKETNWYDAGTLVLAPPSDELGAAVSGAVPSGAGRTVLFVSEDGPTHETVVRDAVGTPVAAISAGADYSPTWAYADAVARGAETEGSSPAPYDPTRVGVRLTLVSGTEEAVATDATASVAAGPWAAAKSSGQADVLDSVASSRRTELEQVVSAGARTSAPATNAATRVSIPVLAPRAQRSVRKSTSAPALRSGSGTSQIADEVQATTVRTLEITGLPLPEDCALYYDFAEEPVDGYVVDRGTNGYDGAAANCTWTSAGRFNGGAMAFDSNNDSINVGYELNFPAWEQYSVSVWFLHDGGGDLGPQYGQKMVDKTSWYHDWHLSIHPVGNSNDRGDISLSLYEGGNGGGMGDDSRNFGDGQWHHVVVVRDGANGQFWVDGVLKDTSTNMISVFSTSPLCIGNSYSGDYFQQKGWSGMLDEVRIFDRPLGADEISELYADGVLRTPGVHFGTNVVVHGSLAVTGAVSIVGGVTCLRPLGDLSCGIYTNGVPPSAE